MYKIKVVCTPYLSISIFNPCAKTVEWFSFNPCVGNIDLQPSHYFNLTALTRKKLFYFEKILTSMKVKKKEKKKKITPRVRFTKLCILPGRNVELLSIAISIMFLTQTWSESVERSCRSVWSLTGATTVLWTGERRPLAAERSPSTAKSKWESFPS